MIFRQGILGKNQKATSLKIRIDMSVFARLYFFIHNEKRFSDFDSQRS